jgi:hypothetical protein
MSIRIKRHWFKEGAERDAAASATVIATAIWKTAMNGLQTVRKARFAVDIGAPYIAVLAEFVTFLVAAADRIAYRHDQGEWRQEFTAALAKRLAEIYQDNLEHLFGPDPAGGYRRAFIELINTRMGEYADCDYTEAGPDFAFLRYFASCVESLLSDPDDRRWALDQIMTVQAPEAIETVERGMRGILGIDPKPRRQAIGGGD